MGLSEQTYLGAEGTRWSCSATANELYDFKTVAIFEHRLTVFGFRYDLPIAFNRNASGVRPERMYKRLQCGPGRNIAELTVQNNLHLRVVSQRYRTCLTRHYSARPLTMSKLNLAKKKAVRYGNFVAYKAKRKIAGSGMRGYEHADSTILEPEGS